jgi:hypothetical protein
MPEKQNYIQCQCNCGCNGNGVKEFTAFLESPYFIHNVCNDCLMGLEAERDVLGLSPRILFNPSRVYFEEEDIPVEMEEC